MTQPSPDPAPRSHRIGEPASRVDGRQKVTGSARYGSDPAISQPAYGYFRCADIARGRISAIDETEARRAPGVLEILTYRNVGEAIDPGKTFDQKGYMGTSIGPLRDDRVHHDGQIIALVVADTFEAARDAAGRLRISYAAERPSATFGSPGLTQITAEEAAKQGQEKQKQQGGGQGGGGGGGQQGGGVQQGSQESEDPKVGDEARAFASAPVKVDARYATPTQHHNPIELFTTTCAFENGKLTAWVSSQNMKGFQFGLAEQLRMRPEDVRVISPFVGGAFGSRGSLTQSTAIVALAARRVGRPVRAELTRDQGFTNATYRAETEHHVRLGATRDGRLVSLRHEGWEVSSRPDNYKVGGTDASTRLYACPNVASKVTIVHADRNTPGFMRSPPEVPYIFALESAMDELSYALGMDPVELRRVNDTQVEPIKGLRYTSRQLMPCFDAAAKAFGWSRRAPQPGSMREGDWLVGYGCASTLYPTQVAPATARVTLTQGGAATVQSGTHEIGTGVMTVVAITASDLLGVPLERVDVQVGDSNLPPAPVAGGSNSTASVCNVVAKACEDIRGRIAEAAVKASDGAFAGADPKALRLADGRLVGPDGRAEPLEKAVQRVANGGAVEAYAENIPHGAPPEGIQSLYKGVPSIAGGAKLKDRIQFAFGASFVEVRVHRLTGEVRTPRMVGAYAFGRVMNPKAARSQLMGAQIWGVSAALHEATEIDRRLAKYTNDDLAEYLIPVNADIQQHEIIILPEEDRQVNDLGVKGVGELGNVGMNAAVANAVFHATGVRVRELPIRLEKLLAGAPLRSTTRATV